MSRVDVEQQASSPTTCSPRRSARRSTRRWPVGSRERQRRRACTRRDGGRCWTVGMRRSVDGDRALHRAPGRCGHPTPGLVLGLATAWSLLLFFVGVIVFLVALVVAAGRSRDATVTLAGFIWLTDVAPRPVAAPASRGARCSGRGRRRVRGDPPLHGGRVRDPGPDVRVGVPHRVVGASRLVPADRGRTDRSRATHPVDRHRPRAGEHRPVQGQRRASGNRSLLRAGRP